MLHRQKRKTKTMLLPQKLSNKELTPAFIPTLLENTTYNNHEKLHATTFFCRFGRRRAQAGVNSSSQPRQVLEPADILVL